MTRRGAMAALALAGAALAVPGAASAASGPPSPTSVPTIAGSAVQGSVLEAVGATWSNADSATTYGYQWLDCDASGSNCVEIPHANAQSYTVQASDVGHTLIVLETASNAGQQSPAVGSAPTALVSGNAGSSGAQGGSLVPQNVSAPTISGMLVKGHTVRAARGRWTGTDASTVWTYQRELCNAFGARCAAISGATSAEYTLLPAQVGHTLVVEVTATDPAWVETAKSYPSGIISDVPPTSFTIVSRGGIPQFTYYIVEPRGHRPPTSAAWRIPEGSTAVPGRLSVSVHPGQTIYFNRTQAVNVSWHGTRTREPEGIHGVAYHVTRRTGKRVRIVMPSVGPAYRPGLSGRELWVLGQLNRRRVAAGARPLRISTVLDRAASLEARDEAVHHRWPDPYFWTIPQSFGWPGDPLTGGIATADAPLSDPVRVLAHWTGGRGDSEAAHIWSVLKTPALRYAGIADGNGAWIIIATYGCPASSHGLRACGLTSNVGNAHAWRP